MQQEYGQMMKKINKKQYYYLLWLTIMNQSQKAQQVMKNTLCLMERLEKDTEVIDLDSISRCMNLTPKLHRFPNKMSKDIWNSIETINHYFAGDIGKVFMGTEEDILKNLLMFRGIKEHKARICIFILQCFQTQKIDLDKMERCHCNILEEDVADELTIINSL